jgi:hypothetical protein
MAMYCIQLFQLRLSPEQSGKVEYERERLLGIAKKFINLLAILLGIANKFINLLAIPSSLSRSYSTFPLCSGSTLIEIAVCHKGIYVSSFSKNSRFILNLKK